MVLHEHASGNEFLSLPTSGRHANHFEYLAKRALKYHEKFNKGVDLRIVDLQKSSEEATNETNTELGT